MAFDKEYLQSLVERPQESFTVEVKRWFDPDSLAGIAKIAKACIAMRNNNGGFLVIGFDNETGAPDLPHTPTQVRSAFHQDKMQAIVTKYASEAFEVEVCFIERDGQEYPIIGVRDGVKKPVAAKTGLKDTSGKALISEHRVYVRSLNSNNTVSTTEATWRDWDRLAENCLDNREADIGRFVRRHLSGFLSRRPEGLPDILKALASPESDDTERACRFLTESAERYAALVKERTLSLPPHGSFEVAFVISGEIPEHSANRNFLNLLASSNPQYGVWPLWGDSRGIVDRELYPYVCGDTWEAFIRLRSDFVGYLEREHLDFWRMDPKGRFYHRKALEEDTSTGLHAPKPMKILDAAAAIRLTGEALAVGLAFARAMKCQPETCELSFCFRWKGLKGRYLNVQSIPSMIFTRGRAYDDEKILRVSVPLDAPDSALSDWVHKVVGPLFEVFDGTSISLSATEEVIRNMLSRQG